jgi:4-hydroxythreonine-4-phosphate dehydrogenase
MSTEQTQDLLPLIAISMGDPAGVGPEVTLRSLVASELHRLCRPVVVGDAGVLVQCRELLQTHQVIRPVSSLSEARFEPGAVNVLDQRNVHWPSLQRCRVSALSGKAAAEYVLLAVRLAQEGKAQAIVTGPINKEAINLAGYHYVGHTEMISELTQAERTTTMLVAGKLRVTHVTRHVPLGDVAPLITASRTLDTIQITAEGLLQFGIENPRLGVAALNPHAGDGGLIGHEETAAIAPAVQQARQQGINATGPHAADSIFFRAIAGEFDAVVAMYHDQGHIPVKVHDFEGSYTVTLGLPIVRTSVDHGTAFDIAWQGLASPRSMIEATSAAARFAAWRCTGPLGQGS